MKAKIITARIDKQLDFQLEYLKRQFNTHNTTEILEKAISTLYNFEKEREAQKSPFELLDEQNLIGCFEGEKTLSTSYKKELTKSLKRKIRPKNKKE